MATISINLSSAHLARLVDAFVIRYNYPLIVKDEEGNSIPNPQTRGEFAKAILIRWLRNEIQEHEQNEARAVVTVVPIDIT